MPRLLLIFFSIFLSIKAECQIFLCNSNRIYAASDYLFGDTHFKDYNKVKHSPKYARGRDSLLSFFKNNIKFDDKATSIIARYHVTFVVNCKGEVGMVELKSKPFPGADDIVAACKKMSNWMPASIDNNNVDCYVRLGFTNVAGEIEIDYRED